MSVDQLIQKSEKRRIGNPLDEVIWTMAETERVLRALEMEEEARLVRQRTNEWKRKQTQIVFAGGFNSGKSTLINALLRKPLLRTSGIPETAVPTKIMHGSSDLVRVYYRDSETGSQYMTREEYAEQFRACNACDFQEIAYILLEDEAVAEGMLLIDTPGFEHIAEEDLLSLEMFDHADLVIYVINALQMIDAREREIITRFFANGNRTDVFFVVNRINETGGDPEEIHERLRDELHDVFLNQDGVFSEEVFEQKVFYVDALHSMCARTGKERIIHHGIREIREQVPADEDALTGVPEFEAALIHKCKSGRLWTEGVRSFLFSLRSICDAAERKKEEYLRKRNLTLDALNRESEALTWEEKETKRIMEETERDCNTAVREILAETGKLYNEFLYETETNWDSYFETCRLNFGFLDEIGIVGLKLLHSVDDLFSRNPEDLSQTQIKELREGELREKLDPLLTQIYGYVEQNAKKMAEKTALVSNKVLLELMDTVAKRLDCLEQASLDGSDISNQIMEACLGDLQADISTVSGDINGSQVLTGILLFGNSYLAFDSMFQEMNWMDFITEAVSRQIYASTVSVMIGTLSGTYVTYFIIKACYMMFRRQEAAQAAGKRIVISAKKGCMYALRGSWTSVEKEMEKQLSEQLTVGNLSREICGRLEEQQRLLDKVREEKRQTSAQKEENEKRMDDLCNQLYCSVEKIADILERSQKDD